MATRNLVLGIGVTLASLPLLFPMWNTSWTVRLTGTREFANWDQVEQRQFDARRARVTELTGKYFPSEPVDFSDKGLAQRLRDAIGEEQKDAEGFQVQWPWDKGALDALATGGLVKPSKRPEPVPMQVEEVPQGGQRRGFLFTGPSAPHSEVPAPRTVDESDFFSTTPERDPRTLVITYRYATAEIMDFYPGSINYQRIGLEMAGCLIPTLGIWIMMGGIGRIAQKPPREPAGREDLQP